MDEWVTVNMLSSVLCFCFATKSISMVLLLCSDCALISSTFFNHACRLMQFDHYVNFHYLLLQKGVYFFGWKWIFSSTESAFLRLNKVKSCIFGTVYSSDNLFQLKSASIYKWATIVCKVCRKMMTDYWIFVVNLFTFKSLNNWYVWKLHKRQIRCDRATQKSTPCTFKLNFESKKWV